MAHRQLGSVLLATVVVAGLPGAIAGAQQAKTPDAPLPVLDSSSGAAPLPPAPGVRAAAQRLREKLGRETIVDIDPKSGTPREVLRLDGFLSTARTATRQRSRATGSRITRPCSASTTTTRTAFERWRTRPRRQGSPM